MYLILNTPTICASEYEIKKNILPFNWIKSLKQIITIKK